MKQFDITKLDQLVEEGKLMVQTHPTLPLRIYKYTPELQFSKGWDALTSRCRGLVVDNDGFQYSNPIPKFFNIEELQADLTFQVPDLPYEITDKVDGSCIEVFWYKDNLIVCTLGSFMSDQAKLAQQIINNNPMSWGDFETGKTYIFELVAPENRIVLDYGLEKKLVLLTVRDNDTDVETLPDIGFPKFPKVDIVGVDLAHVIQEKNRPDFINKEGFVIKFSNGFRIKVKYEEYFRLHKLMTGVNEKFVWEFLRDGKPLPLVNVPDEFFQYVKSVKERLEFAYQTIDTLSKNVFSELNGGVGMTRKEFALRALNHNFSGVLFKMLEGKDYSQIIWKMIEPKITDRPKFNSFRGTTE